MLSKFTGTRSKIPKCILTLLCFDFLQPPPLPNIIRWSTHHPERWNLYTLHQSPAFHSPFQQPYTFLAFPYHLLLQSHLQPSTSQLRYNKCWWMLQRHLLCFKIAGLTCLLAPFASKILRYTDWYPFHNHLLPTYKALITPEHVSRSAAHSLKALGSVT